MQSTVIFPDNNHFSLSQERINAEIENLLKVEDPKMINHTTSETLDIADQILEILISSSRQIRKGPKPTPETTHIIKQNLNNIITNNRPILVAISYGCHKTVQFANYSGVDIAELFSVVQLIRIGEAVSRVYAPGIQYYLSIHDSWWRFIYGNDDKIIDEYCNGLEQIVKILDAKNIETERLSKVIDLYGKDIVIQKSEEFARIFNRYWNESEMSPESAWIDLPSFIKLKEVGWRGTIPQEMRDFYISKMNRMMPTASLSEKIDSICRYFAFGRVIDTYDFSKRKQAAINFTYITPPPGVPKICVDNRLFIRSMLPKTTSKQLPPWTAKGIIKYPNIYPSLMTDNDVTNYQLIKHAYLKISNGLNQIELPADIYG